MQFHGMSSTGKRRGDALAWSKAQRPDVSRRPGDLQWHGLADDEAVFSVSNEIGSTVVRDLDAATAEHETLEPLPNVSGAGRAPLLGGSLHDSRHCMARRRA